MRREPVGARCVPAEFVAGRIEPPLFMFEPVATQALAHLETAAGLAPKILSIVAPVGYGKTVLMSRLMAQLRRKGRRCVWFSLDDRDVAVENFIQELEALLAQAEAAPHPTQALFRGQESLERRIAALMEAVNSTSQPVTVFLDNLHFCTDAAFARLLDKLAFSTHPAVHLVLSSIRDLPLDVPRAQLQGLIRQIGPRELSFGEAEIATLLGPALVQGLDADGVAAIALRTEGWPAAVRMVQLILSNASDPKLALDHFSGSDESLVALLNRQVLQGFPADARLFLLKVALLRTFGAELCVHAIGSDETALHLADVLDRKVFLIPMDRNGQAYRLHGLFRDFLLREGERVLSLACRQDILLRAARWSAQRGDGSAAVEYALASGSPGVTSEILEPLAAVVVRDRGQVRQYVQWMEALHAQGHQGGPEAEYWFAWALTFYRRYDYARQQLSHLAERVEKADAPPLLNAQDLQRRIQILRTSIDSLSGRLEDAYRGASHWLAGVTEGQDHPFNITAAHCIESGYYASTYRFVDARRAIQAARAAAFQTRSAYVDAWVSAYAALAPIYQGDYGATFNELNEALDLAHRALGSDADITGTLAMMAARCAIEIGRDDEARALLVAGLLGSRTHGFLEATACGLQAATQLWTGAAGDAVSLPQLREIASTYAPRLSLMLSCYVIQRLLVLGRLDQARMEAEHIGLTGPAALQPRGHHAGHIGHLDALIAATRIRLLIAMGQYKSAETLIEEAARRAKTHSCAADQVDLALSAATLAVRAGEHAWAVRHTTRAVSLAAPRGMVRPFRDHAETIAAVVGDTRLSTWAFATSTEREFFRACCRSLPFADPSLADKLDALCEDEAQSPAQLTSRELELLGYIEVGFSNQQMADRIDVSLTTVKWHLQNMYGKLAVKNRSAALARARVMNLLQR